MSNDALKSSRKDSVLVVTREKAQTFIDMFAAKEYLLFSLDGAGINSKEELLVRLAQEMKFPNYFGQNWDALEESLRDLDWLSAKGYVIRFANADNFIKNHPLDFRMLVEIVESVSHYWNSYNVEFTLIVETDDSTIL